MINSELLKEAIADAKAVRATSLANAKAALEEAFAPRFEAMFAEKLKEDAQEEEEESLQEVEAPNQVSGKGGEAKGPATKPVTKGNPKKVSDANTNFKTVAVGGAGGAKGSGVPVANNKIDESSEEEEEGKKMDESGLTSEDLDEIIKELEDEVAGEEEGKAEPVSSSPEEIPSPEEEPHVDGCKCDACLNNIGGEEGSPEADVNAEPGSEVDINLGPEAGAEAGAELPPEVGMNAGGVEQPAGEEQPVEEPFGTPENDEDENINLEELLAAINEEAEEEEEEGVSEGKLPPWLKKGGKKNKTDKKEEEEESVDETVQNHGLPTSELAGQNKIKSTLGGLKAPHDSSKKQVTGKNHNISGRGNIGSGSETGKPVSEQAQYKVALKEAYKTIEFLRGQINEVSLMNTKLLYTNKLFKEFADVLDESYRMKIVENFDLTKNVREAKLAYALLAESLNFGLHVSKNRGTKPIVKSGQTKGIVKQIAEGFASKPVSSTKPSNNLITEGTEMALRFKKLAGIKDTPKTTTDKK